MSLARKITAVGGATLLSRLLGFARDVGVAALLGAGALADAYFAATQIANLARKLLAEGALNAAFVPAWLRLRRKGGTEDAARFAGNLLGLVAAGLGIIAAAVIVFAPTVIAMLAPGFGAGEERFGLAVEFLRLSAPYLACAGIAAVAAAVLNGEGRVKAASYGLVIFNCVLVAAIVMIAVMDMRASATAARILSASIVVAGLAQIAIVATALWRMAAHPPRISFRPSPDVLRLIVNAGPGLIAGGIPQLKLMVGALVASSSPAAVSWLYYANRLYELPLGVAALAISSVLVPLIANAVQSNEAGRIAEAQSRGIEIAMGLALPSAIAFVVLAEPIAAGLFQRGAFGADDSRMVAAALVAIAAGLPGHVLEKLLGAISFAHLDTRTPMITALCGLGAATVGAAALFPRFGHVGIAAAIALSAWVGALLLGAVVWRRGWLVVEKDAARRLLLVLLAALVMGAVIACAQGALDLASGAPQSATARLAILAGFVATGLATYLAAIQLLGLARAGDLVAALRGRR
jgi:putative peptidoglycan lipid II flippase